EGTHVGEVRAIEKAEEQAREPSGDELRRVHAAGLAPAPDPRADDEILLAGKDGRDQAGYELGAIAAVAVEEHDDLAVAMDVVHSRLAGPAIAALRLVNHPRAGGLSALGGAVAAAIVHDHDLADRLAQHGADDLADRLLLVQGGDDHRD